MINLEKQNLTYPNISIQLTNNHNNSYELDEYTFKNFKKFFNFSAKKN